MKYRNLKFTEIGKKKVGNERSIKSVKKSPHPREKNLNKQYYNTI